MTSHLSIIVPTVFRGDEFKRFLGSLEKQTNLSWIELIVVDQNEDNRVAQYLYGKAFEFSVTHLREKKISLSYAKNKGLEKASGKYCCFLDDDCWLDENFLKNIFLSLKNQSTVKGLLLKAMTPQGRFLVPSRLFPGYELTCRNITESFYAPQIAQIYPTAVLKELKGFNENLGIGTNFGSAEDTDMLVRVVNQNVKFVYLDNARLFHPEVDYTSMTPSKSFQYGLGFGAFCRIHGWTGYWIYKMIRSLGGMFISILKNPSRSRSYFETFRGRWDGFWSYR